MTTHELARQLLDGPNLPVHLSYPSGDHWRTQLAPEITSVSDGDVAHSDYHGKDRVVEESEDGKRVILLS